MVDYVALGQLLGRLLGWSFVPSSCGRAGCTETMRSEGMPYGKKLTLLGDWTIYAAAIFVVVYWLCVLCLANRQDNQASCERAEAVNDAYMRGFRAGQLEGIQESIERIEAATASVNDKPE